jgi:uncharacterized protein YegL
MPKVENMVPAKTYVEIAFMLGRSGSMGGKEGDVIGGFNNFLKEQKEVEGKANMTTVLFDDKYELLYEDKDLQEVKDLGEKEYFVRGMTSLYDAMGKTITTLKGKIDKMDEKERPDKVIVATITDGLENNSKEFSNQNVKALIEELKEKNWEFMFLGSDLRAVSDARDIGIPESHAMLYSNSNKGTSRAYGAISAAIGDSRMSKGTSKGFAGIKTTVDEDEE